MYVSACRLEEALCMTVIYFSTECRILFFRRKENRSEQCKGHGARDTGRERERKLERGWKTETAAETQSTEAFQRLTTRKRIAK